MRSRGIGRSRRERRGRRPALPRAPLVCNCWDKTAYEECGDHAADIQCGERQQERHPAQSPLNHCENVRQLAVNMLMDETKSGCQNEKSPDQVTDNAGKECVGFTHVARQLLATQILLRVRDFAAHRLVRVFGVDWTLFLSDLFCGLVYA